MSQLSKEELVEIIINQNKAIRDLQKIILELQQEIERLKISRDLDSKNSSKPPSGDIHKKSENKKAPPQEESNQPTIEGYGKISNFWYNSLFSLGVTQASFSVDKDALKNIENIVGTDFNDKLSGSTGANLIAGGAGKDIFTGDGGVDTFVY